MRHAGIEQQHITGSYIIIHIIVAHMTQATLLNKPEHIIFVKMLREFLQDSLKPIGFYLQFFIIFYKTFFIFTAGSFFLPTKNLPCHLV